MKKKLLPPGSNESERIVTWIKWKWKCCHLDDMKVKVISPGWDGSWSISLDGTVQPNSCSFLSWFHVKLCWPMTIVSGGEGIHAMCFFYHNERSALTHVDFIVASLCSHLWYNCILSEILDLIYCFHWFSQHNQNVLMILVWRCCAVSCI